jgi:hypothetical protein
MMKFLMIMQLVAQLFPIIAQTIKSVEEALPEPGYGSKKLEVVRTALQSAFNSVEGAKITFDELWPTVNNIITMLVSLYNASGLFKKHQ